MGRPVEMMGTTDCCIGFGMLTRCLASEAAVQVEPVEKWYQELVAQHGDRLTRNWYAIHVGAQDSANHGCTVTDFDEERYGKPYGPGPIDHQRRIQMLVDLEILR